MKTKILTFLLVFFSVPFFAQNPIWIMAPKYYNVINNFFTNLPQGPAQDDYHGQAANVSSNAIADKAGNLRAFIIDNNIYDDEGYLIGNLGQGSEGRSEVAIVPDPGNCDRVYIFSVQRNYSNFFDTDKSCYSILDFSQPSNWNSSRLGLLVEENIVFFSGFSGQSKDANTFISISRKRSDNSHLVFISTSKTVRVYKLDENGLVFLSTMSTGGNAITSLRSEMELFESNNPVSDGYHYRIAVPIFRDVLDETVFPPTISFYHSIFTAKLNENGQIISNSALTFNYEVQSSEDKPFIKGLEFDKTGRYLFISHIYNSTYPSGIDYVDFTNPISWVPLNQSGTNDFQNSQIEYGVINGVEGYFLINNSKMGVLTVSQSGTISFNPSFNQQGVAPTDFYIPNNLASYSDFLQFNLPDQIDGMNYLNDFNLTGYDIVDYTVQNSATWLPGANPFSSTNSNELYIKNDLIVPAGVTLTIKDMNLYFASNARLIVQNSTNQLNGGRLILNNTKLTSETRCNGPQMWQGVEVRGSSSQIQGVVGNTKQGSISVFGNSVIEHAITGIFAGRYLKVTSPSTGLITFFQASNGGGGIVETGTATFFNNETDIQFSPYLPSNGLTNKSRLSNTTFKTNGLLLIPTKSPLYHVDVRNIRGILIEGCDFINETPTLYALNRQGIGINSNGSSILVKKGCLNPMTINCVQNDPNTFTNLHYGIYTSGALTSAPSLCDGSVFNQNNIGIYDRSGMNNTFTNNSFTVAKINPSNPSGITQTAGIYMLTATGYKVEGNYFTTSSTGLSLANSRTFGVVVNNSGPVANEIYRNVFENLRIGGQSENINGSLQGDLSIGLQWKCNTFRNSLLHDLTVLNGRIDFHQGYEAQLSSDNVTSMRRKAANNVFSLNNESPSLNHDILCQSMDQEIKYVYLNNASHKPDSYTLNATPNMGVSIAMQYFNQVPVIPASDGCPVKIKTIVGLNPIQWNVNIQKIGDLENAISNTNSSDASYQKLVQELSGLKHDVYSELSEMINLYANDSTSVRLDSLMQAIRTFSDDVNISKILLENHLHNNRFEEALNVLQASMLTSEEVDFYSLLIQLGTESNGFEEELSNEQKEMILETISNFTNENLRIRAQAIVADYDQTSVYSFLEASNERSQLISENEQALSAVSSQFKVYPNPSVGSFRILNTSEEKEEYVLTIKNILGQTVWTGEMNRKEKFINIESKDAGIYIVEISKKSGEITETIKIVKN